MKNYLLLVLCASLFFTGCEKDDGFRAVMIEMEFGVVAVPLDTNNYNGVEVGVELSSQDPDTYLGFFEENISENVAAPKKVVKSEEVIWAVGTNVTRYISLEGDLDGDYKLPCDVTIRIKADNKVIWSYSAKKGDDGFFEDANLIIR